MTQGAASGVDATPADCMTHSKPRFGSDAEPPSLYWRMEDGRLTIVSEPLDEHVQKWLPVPPGHVLVVPRLHVATLNDLGADHDRLVGVMVRRNALVMLMCMELMLNAVILALVTFSLETATLSGAVLVFLIIATGLGYMAYRNVWAGVKH